MAANPARRSPIGLIAAGGSGTRLGAGCPKALVECGGRSLLAWALESFVKARTVEVVVVAAVAGERASFEREAEGARADGLEVVVCDGGPSRSHSVREALAVALEIAEPELVLVHDAARPLAGAALVDACVEALQGDECADGLVPAAPVTDTIKQTGDDLVVSATLDRSTLWAVQTPQAFRTVSLARALGLDPGRSVEESVLESATDDASLIELEGGRVVVLPHDEPNPKVTTVADLELAARLLAARAGGSDPGA